MNRVTTVLIGLAAVGSTYVAGCATTSGGDDLESLRRSVKAYNEAYRWKNFERASAYLPEDLRMSFLAAYEEDEKSLHIEGYQVMQVRMVDERAADVEIRVTYMMLPSVVVQNRRMTQHWHRIGGRWTLETEDNSIRPLGAGAVPTKAKGGDPDAFGGGPAASESETEVQVTDPDGHMIRDDTDGRGPLRPRAREVPSAPPQ